MSDCVNIFYLTSYILGKYNICTKISKEEKFQTTCRYLIDWQYNLINFKKTFVLFSLIDCDLFLVDEGEIYAIHVIPT